MLSSAPLSSGPLGALPLADAASGLLTDADLAAIDALIVARLGDVASAVWTHVLESTLTAEQIQRILLAGMSGNRTGIPGSYVPGTEIKYWSVDGTKSRITYTPTDADSNGTSVLDGS